MHTLPKKLCMGNHDFAFLSALVPSRKGLIFCSSWDQYPDIIQYHLMSLSGLAEGESLSLLSKSIPSGWRNGAVGEPSRIVLCPGIPECSEHFTTNITLSCTLLLICFLISLLFPVTRSCLDLYSSWFLPPIHTCVPP